MKAIRNEEYSIYYHLQSILTAYNVNLLTAYPYNEIQTDRLVLPAVSIGHASTVELGSELGGLPWKRRMWEINVFASNNSQRDELMEVIYDALENAIPLKDYTTGLPPSVVGQPTLASGQVEERKWRPVTGFSEYSRIKFWRALLTFYMVSTLS